MRLNDLLIALPALVIVLNACDKEDEQANNPVVFSAAGNIQPTVDQFRAELGAINTQPGATTGRREISWEAVPDEMLEKTLPAQFFNQTGNNANPSLQRGFAYDPNQDFRVSKTGFAGIDADAASEFSAFSGAATFANVGTNLWQAFFQVAGTSETAATRGFGMVVSDIDLPNNVEITFFNGDKELGKIALPKKESGSNFSFAGVLFPEPVITRIQVSHHGVLSAGKKDISQGGTDDLVVLDDFIYSEPVKK